ncbi:hypothetical protein ACP0HM_16780 [Escherichia coli]
MRYPGKSFSVAVRPLGGANATRQRRADFCCTRSNIVAPTANTPIVRTVTSGTSPAFNEPEAVLVLIKKR